MTKIIKILNIIKIIKFYNDMFFFRNYLKYYIKL